jgi:hypothetical protein
MIYHVGLDFGTYQTKCCVYNAENGTHEFLNFPNGSFFHPSIVSEKDGRFAYGLPTSQERSFSYFKIAAAEDEEFREEIDQKDARYADVSFGSHTPEFLATVYLTYVLILVHNKLGVTRRSGLIPRLLAREVVKKDLVLHVQLGIPTEWSYCKNLYRKRKFESIILLADALRQHFNNNVEHFQETSIEDLKTLVAQLLVNERPGDKEAFEKALNTRRLRVFPETAAGLTMVVKSKQLAKGFYAIMDIGGGTTDISFFGITDDMKIRYLASESYMLAANDVYRNYTGEISRTSEGIVRNKIDEGTWSDDDDLYHSLKNVNDRLHTQVYRLFNSRVYSYHRLMRQEYKGQPLLLYGGGSQLPFLAPGQVRTLANHRVVIHDNGNRSTPVENTTYLEKKALAAYTVNFDIMNMPDGQDFPMLIVALGLSFAQPIGAADWFSPADYHAQAPEKAHESDVRVLRHSEYMWDVLRSRWTGQSG